VSDILTPAYPLVLQAFTDYSSGGPQ